MDGLPGFLAIMALIFLVVGLVVAVVVAVSAWIIARAQSGPPSPVKYGELDEARAEVTARGPLGGPWWAVLLSGLLGPFGRY
jgi:hypothetical protein